MRGSMGDLMCCSSEKSLDERNKARRIGIDELQWSILTACGLENSLDVKRAVDVKVLEEAHSPREVQKEQYTPRMDSREMRASRSRGLKKLDRDLHAQSPQIRPTKRGAMRARLVIGVGWMFVQVSSCLRWCLMT